MDSNSFEFPPASEHSTGSDTLETAGKPRGFAWLAWLVIVVAISAMMFPHFLPIREVGGDPSIILFEIQARYLVGVASTFPQGEKIVQDQIETVYSKGSLRPRLIGAVLLGELVGPEKAAKSLEELESMVQSGTVKAD